MNQTILADQYGELSAQIKALQEKQDAIKAQLLAYKSDKFVRSGIVYDQAQRRRKLQARTLPTFARSTVLTGFLHIQSPLPQPGLLYP